MTSSRKIEIWSAGVAAVMLTIAAVLLVHWHRQSLITLQGAVMVQDADPRKELPIADRDHQHSPAPHVRALLIPQRQLSGKLRVLIDSRLDLERPVDQLRLGSTAPRRAESRW